MWLRFNTLLKDLTFLIELWEDVNEKLLRLFTQIIYNIRYTKDRKISLKLEFKGLLEVIGIEKNTNLCLKD